MALLVLCECAQLSTYTETDDRGNIYIYINSEVYRYMPSCLVVGIDVWQVSIRKINCYFLMHVYTSIMRYIATVYLEPVCSYK